jgi:hypothetical protein
MTYGFVTAVARIGVLAGMLSLLLSGLFYDLDSLQNSGREPACSVDCLSQVESRCAMDSSLWVRHHSDEDFSGSAADFADCSEPIELGV